MPPIPLAPDPSTTARPGASKRPQNSGPGMAVVLPVYNAAGHIDEIVDRVAAFALTSPHYHFYFVNDGSSDSTGPRLRAALARWGPPPGSWASTSQPTSVKAPQ